MPPYLQVIAVNSDSFQTETIEISEFLHFSLSHSDMCIFPFVNFHESKNFGRILTTLNAVGDFIASLLFISGSFYMARQHAYHKIFFIIVLAGNLFVATN